MTCTSCGGAGTSQVPIYNTVTHRWTTLTQTCLPCNGSGQAANR